MIYINKNATQFNILNELQTSPIWDDSKVNVLHNANELNQHIEVKDNSALTIVEIFDENTKEQTIKRDIKIGKNSTLEYIKISKSNTDLEFNYTIENEEEAKTLFHVFEIGSANTKNTIEAKLEEKDIDIKINALVKLNEKASSFNSFDIKHIHPNTFSDIKIRHLLDDNSKAEFEATTVIGNDALYSKAFQDSKTILLDDNATIKARPHLEILTDELEASHGATTGGIDMDALYYLQSRGLDEKSAYKILIEAFYNITIENIKNESIKEWLYEQIRIQNV